MKPRGNREHGIAQIAAAVVASAANVEVGAAMQDAISAHNAQYHPGRDCRENGHGECADRFGEKPPYRRHDSDCQPGAGPDHEGDCQAAQHTYVAPGTETPGVFTHGVLCREDETVWRCLDVVGANRRRLLVRDDADGAYVGGCLIADPHDLDDLIAKLGDLSARMHERRSNNTAPGGTRLMGME